MLELRKTFAELVTRILPNCLEILCVPKHNLTIGCQI
jgi:hypothetical protein